MPALEPRLYLRWRERAALVFLLGGKGLISLLAGQTYGCRRADETVLADGTTEDEEGLEMRSCIVMPVGGL